MKVEVKVKIDDETISPFEQYFIINTGANEGFTSEIAFLTRDEYYKILKFIENERNFSRV